MIIHKVLDHLFSSQGTVKVLRVLNNSVVGLTGRQIASLAGITHQAAHNSLANLESLKLINRVIGGSSHLFTLNRDNFLSKQIIEFVFNTEIEFREKTYFNIKKALSKQTVSLIIFGSVARKEELVESDLDLCIVYGKDKKTLEKHVSTLQDNLHKEFGVTLAPFYIPAHEFRKRSKTNKPPVNDIIKDGIVISGNPIRELL
ncbi:MAG: nucleotidyltransferase domain-containing protein [Melioribacteraceae bacterium]